MFVEGVLWIVRTGSPYASQPDETPRLTPFANADLHRTVSALIGYPEARDQGELVRSRKQEADDPSEHATAVECLRAAFGIVRSAYSLSVISRLDPDARGPAGFLDGRERHEGFLEEHRQRVRWMLKEALWLQRKAERWKNPAKPFYAEELVWLYNECGVLSLVQGRIGGALAMLERADAVARQQLEPMVHGALRSRVALNRALADMDRGRLHLCREVLERIRGIEDEDDEMQLTATGFLGMIEHISGRMDNAIEHYKRALDGNEAAPGLVKLRRSRAAAVIARSYGDLKRRQGDIRGSRELYSLAFTMALEGGHEDLRHAVVVARIRTDVLEDRQQGKAISAAAMTARHLELDEVENYARLMGIFRLHTEADGVRALMHRLTSDLPAAAAVAARSLAIASANDLRLRKTSLLLELAQIQASRSLHRESQTLLLAALDTARDCHYHSAFMEAQDLLAKVRPLADVT